ncbi:uncharacterized protein BJ212DRAFT_1302471 [Suillus subaureus]|uniref:Uncharacterized protein n=1 Tax=Suillus subaureus TaxID=48587 RepID=A0A9P7J998_9AGAM|nr:uncharacterized protein BJ212DRAFT_1302471 [Suillus subaureus]KAG1809627.1 hypothetical protein BJ212DRAFT_1302471 [Suillus subaureus]
MNKDINSESGDDCGDTLAGADMHSISNSSEEHMDCTGSQSESDDELEEAENKSQSATYEFNTDLIDGDEELDKEADDDKDGSVLDDKHKEQLLLDDSSEEEGSQDELDDAILGAEDGEGAADTEEDYGDYADTLASASLAMPGMTPVRPVAAFGTLPQTCGICRGLHRIVPTVEDGLAANKFYISSGSITEIQIWNVTTPVEGMTSLSWNTRPQRIALMGTVAFLPEKEKIEQLGLEDGWQSQLATRFSCGKEASVVTVEVACDSCRIEFKQLFSVPPLAFDLMEIG